MVTVVAINGSRREGSYTKLALELALDAAAEAGAEVGMIDLGERDIPLYHPDHDPGEEVSELMREVRESEGVIVGSPVYHGSYSSAFKSFHDYCGFEEYENTSVGLLASAGGGSYGSTLDHLRATIRGVHGWVVPQQVGIRGARDHFERGELTTESLAERIAELGRVVSEDARLRASDREAVPAED
ncbi:NADPH-dependent oxidoreductase [Halobacteriales archaeon QS_3_64_16]|nr:MAG: NADPH-dependent oxidoreductase [Halobacteriales archaeon QS_3_64_16]